MKLNIPMNLIKIIWIIYRIISLFIISLLVQPVPWP